MQVVLLYHGTALRVGQWFSVLEQAPWFSRMNACPVLRAELSNEELADAVISGSLSAFIDDEPIAHYVVSTNPGCNLKVRTVWRPPGAAMALPRRWRAGPGVAASSIEHQCMRRQWRASGRLHGAVLRAGTSTASGHPQAPCGFAITVDCKGCAVPHGQVLSGINTLHTDLRPRVSPS